MESIALDSLALSTLAFSQAFWTLSLTILFLSEMASRK